jgi:hypothetical protein
MHLTPAVGPFVTPWCPELLGKAHCTPDRIWSHAYSVAWDGTLASHYVSQNHCISVWHLGESLFARGLSYQRAYFLRHVDGLAAYIRDNHVLRVFWHLVYCLQQWN